MTAKWSFMVYLAGDNNLSSAGAADLAEMCSVGSSDAVNVIAQYDNSGAEGTRRFRVRKGSLDLLEALGETDSGDPNVLLDFVKWAHDTYPAERNVLILWNHGGGWTPTEIDAIAQEVKAQDYGRAEGAERAASPLGRTFFRSTLQTILSLNLRDRAICADDDSQHSIDTVELGKVLAKMVAVLGQPLELLGMDACLMSNLEVAYQARPYVNYVVASEESEPNEGWPYGPVLARLVAQPTLATSDLASHIVDAYVHSYVDRHYTGDVTQSALDLARIGALDTAVDHFADALYARLPAAGAQVWKAHRKTKRFYHKTLADVGSFAAQVKKGTRNLPTRAAADEIAAALTPGPGQFVVAEAHNGSGVTECTGVTVYLPSPLDGISRYYADLEFAKHQQWARMLEAYVEA